MKKQENKQEITSKTLACRLPKELHNDLLSIIEHTGHNVNSFINQSIEYYIRLIKNEAEETKHLKVARFAYKISQEE